MRLIQEIKDIEILIYKQENLLRKKEKIDKVNEQGEICLFKLENLLRKKEKRDRFSRKKDRSNRLGQID